MAKRSDSTENLTTDARPSTSRDSLPTEEVPESETKNNHKDADKKKKAHSKKTSAVVKIFNNNISNSHGIQLGNNTYINIGKRQKKVCDEVVETVAITKLLQQRDPVTIKLISFVSQHVGDNWRSLARVLNYSEGEIHQFYEKNIIVGVHEVVYQILLDWMQNKPEEAIIGTLITALWKAPEKRLVQKISKELPL